MYRSYLDYQASPAGADVTAEVKTSRVCVVFALDLSRSRGPLFEQQRRAIEQMEVDEEQAHPEPMELVGDEIDPMDTSTTL